MQAKYSDINHTNVFLDQSPKAKEIKAKIKKWDLIKLISIYTAKEPINKTKRQSTDQKKSFANIAIDKGLIFKICKQPNSSYNSTTKKKNPIKKLAEDMNSHFSKENIQMANRHMKRCSTLLIIRGIKTAMRYCLIQVRMDTITKCTNSKFLHCGRNINWCSHYGKQFRGSSKT